MSRIFNIIMLLLVAGIYYVQNGGFESSQQPIQNAEAQIETPVQNAAVKIEEQPVKAVVIAAPKQEPLPKNALTPKETKAIKDRFTAQRLAASTLIRSVKLTKQPTETPNILLVSGNVVNARALPTTSSAVLAKLRRGTQVEPTGQEKGAWAQVIVLDTGIEVWMHSKFLTDQS